MKMCALFIEPNVPHKSKREQMVRKFADRVSRKSGNCWILEIPNGRSNRMKHFGIPRKDILFSGNSGKRTGNFQMFKPVFVIEGALCFICTFMKHRPSVSRKDSFWKRGKRQPGSGLLHWLCHFLHCHFEPKSEPTHCRQLASEEYHNVWIACFCLSLAFCYFRLRYNYFSYSLCAMLVTC